MSGETQSAVTEVKTTHVYVTSDAFKPCVPTMLTNSAVHISLGRCPETLSLKSLNGILFDIVNLALHLGLGSI